MYIMYEVLICSHSNDCYGELIYRGNKRSEVTKAVCDNAKTVDGDDDKFYTFREYVEVDSFISWSAEASEKYLKIYPPKANLKNKRNIA